MQINTSGTDIKPAAYYVNRDEMLKFIPDNVHTLLDVGCGEGLFGQSCKKTIVDIEVWGVELNKQVGEKAREKLDRVLIGNIEFDELDIPDHYFDVIVFNDVLEHLQSPWNVLEKIKKYLRTNGYVTASIPNVRYYDVIKRLLINKEWEYQDCGVLDKTHLRFFTQKSILRLFKDCNYSVLRLEGVIDVDFPWKMKLVNRLLFNTIEDMKHKQFACVAKSIGERADG